MKKSFLLGLLLVLVGGAMTQNNGVSPQEFELHKREVANEVNGRLLEQERKHNATVEEIKEQSTFTRNLAGFLGGGAILATVMGLLFSYARMRRSAESYIETKVKDKVDQDYRGMVERKLKQLLEDENESIDKLIREKSVEESIRKSFHIKAVVADGPDVEGQAKAVLHELKNVHRYQQVRPIKIGDFDLKAENDQSLILFYNMNGDLVKEHEEELKSILNDALALQSGGKLKPIFLLATNKNWGPLFAEGFREICNAANSVFTLDSRIQESLKYLHHHILAAKK